MSLIDNFDELKSGLKDKWLDYYEANQSWIQSTGIHDPRTTHPDYNFVVGVISVLEPKAAELIYFLSIRIGQCVVTIAITLGLYFDPRVELQARAARLVEIEEIQEAKLLTASGGDYTDPLLEELRREAREINNTSE